ncbi:MAG: hypothetical protein LBH29_00270 [Elusimicrobiota bacterium]|jgi:hypothetical protein|nr:hypothetical protein [Elusimicrobiota bacterium]
MGIAYFKSAFGKTPADCEFSIFAICISVKTTKTKGFPFAFSKISLQHKMPKAPCFYPLQKLIKCRRQIKQYGG